MHLYMESAHGKVNERRKKKITLLGFAFGYFFMTPEVAGYSGADHPCKP